MDRPVKLYDLHPSPNNIKVRLALAYKKIPYEIIPVDPRDRAPVIKASGQSLAPVLLHGETIVYDSFAILRYLDANWPGSPRLFSEDRTRHKAIEEWELFGRVECGAPVGMTFGQALEGKVDPDRRREANARINRAAARVEAALADGPYLMGDAPNAADLTVAPMLSLAVLSKESAAGNPLMQFFLENLKVDNAPKTRDWIGRIMAWDGRR